MPSYAEMMGTGRWCFSEGERGCSNRGSSTSTSATCDSIERLSAWAEALSYNGIRITHTKRDDGSEGFDLEAAPNTENATVN